MKKLSPAQKRAFETIREYRSNNRWVSSYVLGVSEATLNVLLRYGLVEWQHCPGGSGRIEWRAKGD